MILLDLLVRAVLVAFLVAFVVGAIALLLTPPRRDDSRRATHGRVEDLSWLDLMDAARDHPRTIDHVTTCRACLADYEQEVTG